ncbi:MAG TPA: formate--tetrahydrofolate ligase, partial [Bacteroidales bacterium]|nr:formate--tetrahydrofolate ligase [Bacteroidales bacterium]
MAKTNIEIAQSTKLKPIEEIALQLGLPEGEIELYGRYKAKIPLHFLRPEKIDQNRLILVSAISPTPASEGKTTVS